MPTGKQWKDRIPEFRTAPHAVDGKVRSYGYGAYSPELTTEIRRKMAFKGRRDGLPTGHKQWGEEAEPCR